MMVTRLQSRQNKLIRSCILQEVLNGKPIEKAYKTLCKEKGKSAIEYTEFEYWYYRFYNGNHDLDYDRSLDPKCHSFSELPIHIIKKVTGKLKLADLLGLRKVSRKLRTFIDENPIRNTCYNFHCYNNSVTIHFFPTNITYEKVRGGCMIECNRKKTFIKEGDYLEMALNDMNVVIKHPKFNLDCFEIDFNSLKDKRKSVEKRCLNYINNVLNSLNHQLHVKELVLAVENLELVLPILPHFEAETLKYMDLKHIAVEKNQSIMQKIYDLEQWKKAKQLHMKKPSLIPLDNYLHFSMLYLSLDTLTAKDLHYFKDILLESTVFDNCCFYEGEKHPTLGHDDICEILGLLPYSNPDFSHCRRLPIPNSNDHYHFKIHWCGRDMWISKHRGRNSRAF